MLSNLNLPPLFSKDRLFEPQFLTMSDDEFDELLDIIGEHFEEVDDIVLYLLNVEMGLT